ncbi:MAG: hypothetical protein KTR32_36895 [Granulosicoccus sp.]|nr:hypothetical protein [Granulosicoccus sp.]
MKVKIIEPGLIATDFAGRSFDFQNDESLAKYLPLVGAVFGSLSEMPSSPPEVVADVIWEAVTDGSDTLRYRAGADAIELLDNRKALDDAALIGGLKAQLGLDKL